MSKHLAEQDIQDGKEILEILAFLNNDKKAMAKVYMSALRDVQVKAEQQKTA